LRRQKAFQTIDEARALMGQRFESARQMPCIFFREARHAHDAPCALVAIDESGEQVHQPDQIQPIALRAPCAPIHFETGGVDDVVRDAVRA
jgi:hypothetical protein